MNITVCLNGLAQASWVSGLRAALPEATVSIWKPGSPPADYAVVWSPPQNFIDEQQGLKTLFNIGAGVDALLQLKLPESTNVVRLDGAEMSLHMSEYLCQTVIRCFREFKDYENTDGWSHYTIKNRSVFPVGIMGLGALGTRVAKSLQLFDYTINGYSRTPKMIEGINCFSGAQGLSEFLKSTRILINLLPLTVETENILNYNTLSQLQKGGYVINVARGGHLVDEDLLALLDDGHLSGATLDVFRTEPLPEHHPFWKNPKITITPHIAARTTKEQSIRQIANKILDLEQGKPITGIVDLQRGY